MSRVTPKAKTAREKLNRDMDEADNYNEKRVARRKIRRKQAKAGRKRNRR